MKHNLKNRPHLIYLQDILSKPELDEFLSDLEKRYPKVYVAWMNNTASDPDGWFEGLEKELRELKKKAKGNNEDYDQGQDDLIREVLGDS